MTEENKNKLKKMVDNTKCIVELYISNNIDDVNTHPYVHAIFDSTDEEAFGRDMCYCISFMEEHYDSYESYPTVSYLWRTVDKGCEDLQNRCHLVYSRGEWFV